MLETGGFPVLCLLVKHNKGGTCQTSNACLCTMSIQPLAHHELVPSHLLNLSDVVSAKLIQKMLVHLCIARSKYISGIAANSKSKPAILLVDAGFHKRHVETKWYHNRSKLHITGSWVAQKLKSA